MKTVFYLALAFTVLTRAEGLAVQDAKKEPPKIETIVVQDQLASSDSRDMVTGLPAKIHIVKLVGGKSYRVSLTSKDLKQSLNPYLRIEDAKFEQIAAGGHVAAVRVKFDAPKDGDYRFIATTQGGLSEYVLKIIPYELLKVRAHEPGKTHEVSRGGLEFESKLEANDASDTVRKGHRAKVFLVKMSKGKNYTIELDSTQFDSYLRFEDSKSKQLAEDDDSGGFPNARIIIQVPEDGVYRIIATTFQGGAQGNFTLRVRDD